TEARAAQLTWMTLNAWPLQTQPPRFPAQIRSCTIPSRTFPWQKPSLPCFLSHVVCQRCRGLTPSLSDEGGCAKQPDCQSVRSSLTICQTIRQSLTAVRACAIIPPSPCHHDEAAYCQHDGWPRARCHCGSGCGLHGRRLRLFRLSLSKPSRKRAHHCACRRRIDPHCARAPDDGE